MNSMSINELQDEVIAEFSDFDDWMDRYQLLIDLGNEQVSERNSMEIVPGADASDSGRTG